MKNRILATIGLLAAFAVPAVAANHAGDRKLDSFLKERAHAPRGTSRVIIQTDGSSADSLIKAAGGKSGRKLHDAQVAEIPDGSLDALANSPKVKALRLDRKVRGTMERTGATVGAAWVQQNLGFDGTGVGVAIIDSGVTPWHDDLGAERVVHFADFINYQPNQYDDYGHGTHVAGVIAGSGYDSNGARRGVAPGSSLVVLKVLDGAGSGYISNVIAALDYATENRAAYNIRVINLSVAAGVYESYKTDPLTLAAKRAVDAGIVVVTAAGNLGHNSKGEPQYGGITAPGNAPWVLTVGASSHMGTVDRSDDTVAAFSSRGPSAIDFAAKPDIVAPGVGIESLTDANTVLYSRYPGARLWGTVETVTEPYLSLSGTSMAAPIVSGTVALMLQANPALTPNAVKAILEYTAEYKDGYKAVVQGAGFLNSRGAVDLAQKFASAVQTSGIDTTTAGTSVTIDPLIAAQPSPTDSTPWSRHIVWGSHRIAGGMIKPASNAWSTSVTWGDTSAPGGENIVWGTLCDPVTDPNCENIVWGTSETCDPAVDPTCENIVWGTSCDPVADPTCENIVWGTAETCDPAIDPNCENIVWGTDCGGEDCENIVWGTSEPCDPVVDPTCENIVWGTAAADENIVWGTSDTCDPAVDPTCENIVWGTADWCDPSVDPTCENIVWGTGADENIVWGTNDENIVWGTGSDDENIVWGTHGKKHPRTGRTR